MQRLKQGISEMLDSEEGRNAQGMAALRRAWQQVAPPHVVRHTGSVIYDRKDPDIVVVFTEDSFFQADLSAEKEIYRALLSDIVRLPTESPLKEVRFAVSRRVSLDKALAKVAEPVPKVMVKPLAWTAEEEGHARESVSLIRDERLKQSLFKAMRAQMEWKKGRDALKMP